MEYMFHVVYFLSCFLALHSKEVLEPERRPLQTEKQEPSSSNVEKFAASASLGKRAIPGMAVNPVNPASGDVAGRDQESVDAISAGIDQVRNASAQLGETAFLRCAQPISSRNDDAEISWLRRRDWHLLTSGLTVFTADKRVQIFHDEHTGDWVLRIRLINHTDVGLYECQISTGSGKLSQLISLSVIQPVAFIEGDQIVHVQKGSSVSLTCVIKQATNPPSFVDWYHNSNRLNLYTLRKDIRVNLSRQSGNTVSVLDISDARETDGGVYTCRTENTRPDSVNVFVSQGDKMAAIQRRKGNSAANWLPLYTNNVLFLLPFMLVLL